MPRPPARGPGAGPIARPACVSAREGPAPAALLDLVLDELVAAGLVELEGDRVRLTEQGRRALELELEVVEGPA